jgi:phosphatidylglycerophosphate synthase
MGIYMANTITLCRVLIALVALLIIKLNPLCNLLATLLIICALLLDALDGYVARYFKSTSLSGGVYDILADRIIEILFIVYFASMSLFSIWIAFIFVIRGLTIDAIRSIFSFSNKTAFGPNTLHTSKWTQFLTTSHYSRGTYNALKLITFVLFSQLLEPSAYLFNFLSHNTVLTISSYSLWICMSFALLRAFPVVLEMLSAELPS